MKTLLTIPKGVIFAVLFLSVLLASCSNRGVENTARIFLQAYYIDHDFDKAAALSTPATQEHIQEWAMLFALTPKEYISAGLYFETFEIEKSDILKTRATVGYRVDNTPRDLLLRKVDGKWLVDMPIEISFSGPRFSLSLHKPHSGGFASAQSQPTRLGNNVLPTRDSN